MKKNIREYKTIKKSPNKKIKTIMVPEIVVPEPLRKFFVILPETVQFGENNEFSYTMEFGRLVAQAVHVARKLERHEANYAMMKQTSKEIIPYEEVTTITLSVRNSKELAKVYREVKETWYGTDFTVETFHDTNKDLFGDYKVQTAVMFGPVTSEEVDISIGHLPLLGKEKLYV